MRLPFFKEQPLPPYKYPDLMERIFQDARSSMAQMHGRPFGFMQVDTDATLVALVDLYIFPELNNYYHSLDKRQKERFSKEWHARMNGGRLT